MKRRILYVVYSLNIGGLERIVVELANSLDSSRYEPFICCIAAAGEFSKEFKYKDNLFVIGNEGRINLRSCRAVYKIAKNNKIDIIHSHNLAGLLHGLPAAKLLKVPLVHTNHGYVKEERQSVKYHLMEYCASRFTDVYVCVSNNLKREVEKRLRMNTDKMVVLHNGVGQKGAYAPDLLNGTREIVIGSIGRLDPIKNYRFLIEAFSEIAAIRQGCRLELIGGGEEYEDLVSLRDSLRIEDKVIFRGFVSNPIDYLKRCDIFALTSSSEGLSMSILEAMSMHKICIVSNVGGNSEIIEDGVNGYMFELDDKKAFIQKMLDIIERIDTEELKCVKEAAGTTIERRFSLESMLNGYCQIYDSIAV